MNFRDYSDYEAGVLVFGDNEGSYWKPNNPGQLFYKDFLKLKKNTELIIHAKGKTFDRVLIQFIGMEFTNADGSGNIHPQANTWCIRFRQKDGTEELVDLHYVGATAWTGHKERKVWKIEVYVTRNLGADLNKIMMGKDPYGD